MSLHKLELIYVIRKFISCLQHTFSTVGTRHWSSSHLKANPDFFLTLTKLFLVPKPDQVKYSELIINLKTYIIDVCVYVNLGLW